MRDVAQAAGVSIGTVDRVLHNRGRFSAQTAERVRASAKRLNFLPNQAASNLKRATTHTFVAVLPYPDQDGGFWCQVVKGVNRALQELSHHYVRVRFAHYDRFDPESFASICAELAHRSDATTDRGIDGRPPAGIILAPTLRAASQRLVERTRPVPVVVLDGELPDVRLLCSISQESLEGGLLAAKLLQVMSPGGRFASIVVGRDDYHLLRRRAGFEAYFDACGCATTERIAVDSEAELATAIEIRHTQKPRVSGFFVTNSAAHIVARASQAYGSVPIVGYDLIAENSARLRSGELSFLIHQQPEHQGYRAVYALYRHVILHEEITPQLRIPVDLVTKETLQFHATPFEFRSSRCSFGCT